MPAVEVHRAAIYPVVCVVGKYSSSSYVSERGVAQILGKGVGDLEHRVVLELIAEHRLQRMVDGIASVAPYGHLARRVIGIRLKRGRAPSRHSQLCRLQAI